MEQYARINVLCVAGFYFDSDCSAKDLERPGLQKLLKDYKKGKFQAVIVTKPDRLYRGNIPPAPKWPFEIISLNAQQVQSEIKMSSEYDVIAEQHEKAVELARAKLRMTEIQLSEKARELEDYQAETIRVIRGESQLSGELLNELVEKAKSEITALSNAVTQAKQELAEKISSVKMEKQEYDKLQSWADLYDNCTFAAKKMIVSQFIKSVYVYRDYTIEVEFNVSFEEFRSLSANCTNDGNERSTVYPLET